MTNRDIKLELTKIAMTCGMSIETAKTFYNWITEEPERVLPERVLPERIAREDGSTLWDRTPIKELAEKTRMERTIIKRCVENDIYYVGDLIRCGARKFRTFNLVGNKTIGEIDETLEEHFQIPNWYTT